MKASTCVCALVFPFPGLSISCASHRGTVSWARFDDCCILGPDFTADSAQVYDANSACARSILPTVVIPTEVL